MVKVERNQLLSELESVTPGLSSREIIEQSSCFVFTNGQVVTFNDEVACFQPTCLPIEGALQSQKFLALLRKLKEKTLRIEVADEKLKIRGKNKRHGWFPLERQVLLPVHTIKKPKHWHKLPADFLEAVKAVKECVGKDETQFHLTCMHLHPDYVEACDNFQAARFTMATGVEKPCLVRKDSLKFITELGMTKFGMTKAWIHFKNPNGLVMACRLYTDTKEFPDLADILKVKGTKMALPKGLNEALERCGILSDTDADENHVYVDVKPGLVEITGRSVSGEWVEPKEADYKGKPFSFTISPQLLAAIMEKYNDCILSGDRLKVRKGKFQYVSVLGTVGQEAEEVSEEEVDEEVQE